MKVLIKYSLVGILIGSFLGLGLYEMVSIFSSTKKEKQFFFFKKKQIIQKIFPKSSPPKKNNPKNRALLEKENNRWKILQKRQQNQLKKRENVFLADLKQAYQEVVKTKNLHISIKVLRHFLKNAPTTQGRLSVLKKIEVISILSKNWNDPESIDKELKKRAP